MAEHGPLRPGDPEKVGDYVLTARLGEGGQGVVFLGQAPSRGRVAVKVLRADLADDEEALERFVREVSTARRVAPFCTAAVIETGIADQRPFIVSEYVDGRTLDAVVAAEGPRLGASLHRLAIGTVTALVAIHQAGIVHRDFKPSNVLLASDGPRVIDFGIARALDRTSTLTAMAVGTPAYMAPEQLAGEATGPATDMFAWGCTMVFAAAGGPPFGTDSLPAVFNRIMNMEPDLGVIADERLRELVGDCLAKDPTARPTAAEALFRLLGQGGAPVPAPGPSPEAASPAILAQGTAVAAQRTDPRVGPPDAESAGSRDDQAGPGDAEPAGAPYGPAPADPEVPAQPTWPTADSTGPGAPPTTPGASARPSHAGPRPGVPPQAGPPYHGAFGQGTYPQAAHGQAPPAQGPYAPPLHGRPSQAQPSYGGPPHAPGGYPQGPYLQGAHPQSGYGPVQGAPQGPGGPWVGYGAGPYPPPSRGTRPGVWIALAVVGTVVVLAVGAVVVALANGDGTNGDRTRAAVSTPSVTATPTPPPAAARSIRLPGGVGTVKENDADPIRLTSYTTGYGKDLYVRKPGADAFTKNTKYFNYTVNADETLAIGTDRVYTTDNHSAVSVIDHGTGRATSIKIAKAPVYPVLPQWSPDGAQGLVTLYEAVGDSSKEYGFAVIDIAARTARVVRVTDPEVGSWSYFWRSDGQAVGTWVGDAGAEKGIRFYDLRGEAVSTLEGIGTPVTVEADDVSPDGTLIMTYCPGGTAEICLWPTAGGSTPAARIPFDTDRIIGWYDDRHIAAWRKSGSGHEAVVIDFQGDATRVLATTSASSYESQYLRYTRKG